MAKTKEAMVVNAGAGSSNAVTKEEMTQLRMKIDKQEK